MVSLLFAMQVNFFGYFYHFLSVNIVAPNILKSNLSIVQVRLGDDIKINCKCYLCMPLTESVWFFDEHQNHQNTYIDQQLTMGEIGNNSASLILEILNATENNAGEYTCRFGNMYGYDEMVIKVEVLLPPQIENLSLDKPFHLNNKEVIVEGSSSHIKCQVKGQPIPIVQWRKDGIPIIYDGRM